MLKRLLKWLFGIKWEQTKLFDVTSLHIGWAAFGTLGFVLLFQLPFLEVWFGFLAFAAIKEYVLDLTFEKGETVLTSTVDAIAYQTGVLLARLALTNPWLGLIGSIVLLVGMAVLDYNGFFAAIELQSKKEGVLNHGSDFDRKRTDCCGR